ncbi:MAG: hypothetical protein AAGH40_11840, partial [Verrucomicrobiota bacterium]
MKIRYIILLVLLVVGLWSASGFVLYNSESRGTFGDMFGAVNALFSGLAFAFLIYTIFLQKEELSLQRNELKLTRSEIAEQKEIMRVQGKSMALQNFEGTFFQMLRLHNDILNHLDILIDRQNNTVVTGRDCFSRIWRRHGLAFSRNYEEKDRHAI